MRVELDRFLSLQFDTTTADNSACTCYLRSNQSDFPRTSLCRDGRIVQLSILSPAFDFSPETFSLERICIPSSIEQISESCFPRLRRLSQLVFEANSHLSVLGETIFYYSPSLLSICIPSSIETISGFCFGFCENLRHFSFEPGCKLSCLAESAFAVCRSLQSMSIPSSIEIIADSCFRGCTNLSNLTFAPDCRVSVLGDWAFAGCSSLRSLAIPAGFARSPDWQ
jgi:hypothetical protein